MNTGFKLSLEIFLSVYIVPIHMCIYKYVHIHTNKYVSCTCIYMYVCKLWPGRTHTARTPTAAAFEGHSSGRWFYADEAGLHLGLRVDIP